MKEKSKLKRYKNPEKQLDYINNWTKDNYKTYTFRLHKEQDKEIIDKLDYRKKSIRELIKEWYFKAKK